MKYKVTRKQPNSRRCFICGLNNEYGLKMEFFELENKELVSSFIAKDEHQSYPGRVHGGVITAILDEVIGRAVMIDNKGMWGVTVSIEVKYKKPVPTDERLTVVGRIVKDSSRLFEGTGEILLGDGTIAASCHATYVKMPIEKIAEWDEHNEKWEIVPKDNDPKEIEIIRE